MDLCICVHQLLDKGSLTIGVVTNVITLFPSYKSLFHIHVFFKIAALIDMDQFVELLSLTLVDHK